MIEQELFVDDFKDPKNYKEILESLTKLSTIGEVKKLVDKVFPTWCVGFLNEFSSDYPSMTENWNKVCKKSKSKPSQIMVIRDLQDRSDNKLVKAFAEIFSSSGFCVRRSIEIVPCNVCYKALPTLALYKIMVEKGKKFPHKWSLKCSTCK